MWNCEGEEIDIPDEFRNRRVVVRLGIRHLWLSPSMFGVTMQVEHLMMCQQEVPVAFPFEVKKLEVQEPV